MKLVRVLFIALGALFADRALRRKGINVLGQIRTRFLGADDPKESESQTLGSPISRAATPLGPARTYDAVDHERMPGVPPEHTDDYAELLDIEGAESFPASDPPSGW